MALKFNEIVADTKNALGKAGKKTNTAVNTAVGFTKAQADKARLTLKKREKIAELGNICYTMHKHDEDYTGEMKKIIDELDEIDSRLIELDEVTGKPKTCSACGTANSSENSYCKNCGERL